MSVKLPDPHEEVSHLFERLRKQMVRFTPDVHREQALLRLTESEMWISHAKTRTEREAEARKVHEYGPQYPTGKRETRSSSSAPSHLLKGIEEYGL